MTAVTVCRTDLNCTVAAFRSLMRWGVKRDSPDIGHNQIYFLLYQSIDIIGESQLFDSRNEV